MGNRSSSSFMREEKIFKGIFSIFLLFSTVLIGFSNVFVFFALIH